MESNSIIVQCVIYSKKSLQLRVLNTIVEDTRTIQ